MSFANPAFLWAFTGLIPLVAIYLLKVRPVRKTSTAYFLWEDIFQQKQSQTLFQRFRDLFSLLMMMLVFSAIVLAMSGLRWKNENKQDLILLIDNSASMNADDGGATRLARAKKVATEIVSALNGTQRCSIATVSNETVFHSHLTENPRELLEAISKITESKMPLNEALLNTFVDASGTGVAVNRDTTQGNQGEPDDAAGSSQNDANELPQIKGGHRVILITDGCLQANVPSQIEILKVGTEKAENIGFVACDFQRLPGGSEPIGAFLQIASTFPDTQEVDIAIYFQSDEFVANEKVSSEEDLGTLVKLIPAEVKPGMNRPEVFQLENGKAGRWIAKLEIEDCLADDNVSYASVAPRRQIPVNVLASDRYFFENSVVAFSRGGGLLKLDVDDPQLLIGQGDAFSKTELVTDGLVFQPTGESDWWENLGEEIEVAAPRVSDPNHPVLRHIDASLMPFTGARQITTPPGAEVWVVAEDETPLIYRISKAGRTVIVVNMDPMLSDFYLSAWFPVLVYSSALHLAGREDELQSTYSTGQYAKIPSKQKASETTIVTPSQTKMIRSSESVGPITETGFYEIKNETGEWLIASSLLSKSETLLDNSKAFDTSQPVNRGSSPVGLLTILAIIVVSVESLLYQRRKVG